MFFFNLKLQNKTDALTQLKQSNEVLEDKNNELLNKVIIQNL